MSLGELIQRVSHKGGYHTQQMPRRTVAGYVDQELPEPWVTMGREAGAGQVVTVLYCLFSSCDANKGKKVCIIEQAYTKSKQHADIMQKVRHLNPTLTSYPECNSSKAS